MKTTEALPSDVTVQLRRIGRGIKTARLRRRMTQEELADRVDASGWSSHLKEVLVLDLTLEDIGDTDLWNRIVAERVAAGDFDEVDTIINGCSAVEVHSADGPPLVDPTGLALRLIGMGAELRAGDGT